jgi:7-cyano-7-deazaguanine synthase
LPEIGVEMKKRAVVLLSGGIDSTTSLALAKDQDYEIYALSVNYGQKHRVELHKAQAIAEYFKVKQHMILNVDLCRFGASALTGSQEVPKGHNPQEIGKKIPATYVPARNTVFLSLALAWAEALKAQDIFIGANAMDYSGYPDCRPEYIRAFENMANLATKAGVEGKARYRIHTPLIELTKGQIIRQGLSLGVDYSMTHSCYDPSPEGMPCGGCDSCILRRKGFSAIGAHDPLEYA